MSEVEASFHVANTLAPMTREAAEAQFNRGGGYAMCLPSPLGAIHFIPHPDHCVFVIFHDIYRRRRWAITWQAASGPEGEKLMVLTSVIGIGHSEKVPDPTRVSEHIWHSMLNSLTKHELAKGKVKLAATCTNTTKWSGNRLTVEHVLPQEVLPTPAFADYEPYVDFDYSPYEQIVQGFPESLFPDGPPLRNPSMKAWRNSTEEG